MKYCASCGWEISDDAVFCAHCGVPVSEPAPGWEQAAAAGPAPQAPGTDAAFQQPQDDCQPGAFASQSASATTDPRIDPLWPVRSKIAAGLFGILLGDLGIHKFYLGKIGLGVVYLLFCWTAIPGVIGLIEGILYLCSSDLEFQIKNQVRIAP